MKVALAGQKGGVGKSTVAICVACEFVARGKRVLLVDSDPQGTARTWADVAAEREQKIPTVIAMGANMHKADQLPRIAEPYDVVIIDCPGRRDPIQQSALLASDVAILPCGQSAPDAWALASSIELVTEAQGWKPTLKAGILITKRQAGTAIGKSAREALAEGGIPVLRSELGLRVAYQEAIAAGQGVTTYAPHHAAADEVRALVRELLALAAGKPLRMVKGTATHD